MNWRTLTAQCRPYEGEIVYTKIDDYRGVRNECQLKYSNRMFWDGEMYIYYTPTHWGEDRRMKTYLIIIAIALFIYTFFSFLLTVFIYGVIAALVLVAIGLLYSLYKELFTNETNSI